MVRVHLFISGVVQGVGYRWSCSRAARSIGVTGWVRNLDDGRVEALAQGTQAQADEFVKWCYRGPAEARVTDIAAAFGESVETFSDFGIR